VIEISWIIPDSGFVNSKHVKLESLQYIHGLYRLITNPGFTLKVGFVLFFALVFRP